MTVTYIFHGRLASKFIFKDKNTCFNIGSWYCELVKFKSIIVYGKPLICRHHSPTLYQQWKSEKGKIHLNGSIMCNLLKHSSHLTSSMLRPVIVLFCHGVFLVGGFWITVKGKQASCKEGPIITLAPHSSYFDALVIVYLNLSTIVVKSSTEFIPLFGCKQIFIIFLVKKCF